MYLQISTVITEGLSKKENDWLTAADPSLFVDVVAGDESQPQIIQMEEVTLQEALEEIDYGQRIVFTEKPESIPSKFEAVPSYWNGEWTFEKMEE